MPPISRGCMQRRVRLPPSKTGASSTCMQRYIDEERNRHNYEGCIMTDSSFSSPEEQTKTTKMLMGLPTCLLCNNACVCVCVRDVSTYLPKYFLPSSGGSTEIRVGQDFSRTLTCVLVGRYILLLCTCVRSKWERH